MSKSVKAKIVPFAKQAPVNARDWTADQTVEAVREQSRQFTQQEADYSQTGGDETERCDLCFFWQGSGRCQVVGGEINAAGLSELYINKEQQDAAMDEDEDMGKSNGKRETKAFSIGQCKVLDEAQGIVEHLVAVMGNVDLGDDVIHQGAFTKTIMERGRKVKVVDSHNYNSAMDAIGVPLALWEVDRSELPPEVLLEFPTATGGLMAKTQFLMDTEMGSEIFKRIKAGAIDQYSIGYDALDIDFSKVTVDSQERTVRNLRTIKLYEYSPVVFAMNEATTTLNAKEKALNLSQQVEDVRSAFHNQYNSPNCYDYWVNTVYDEFIIVTYEGSEGVQYFQVPYTHEEAGVTFTPRAEWTEGTYEFIEKSLQVKAGRMLSAANADRISGALLSLMDVLERAGIDIPGFDTSAAHEDDEEKARYFIALEPHYKVEEIELVIKRIRDWIENKEDRKICAVVGVKQVTRVNSDGTVTYILGAPGDVHNYSLSAAPETITVPSEDVKINIDPPAPETQVADNEHQAGPQSAPTSNDVLTQIKLYEAQLNLMEV